MYYLTIITSEEDGSDGSDDNDDEKYEFDQLMLDNQPAGKVHLIIKTLFFSSLLKNFSQKGKLFGKLGLNCFQTCNQRLVRFVIAGAKPHVLAKTNKYFLTFAWEKKLISEKLRYYQLDNNK